MASHTSFDTFPDQDTTDTQAVKPTYSFAKRHGVIVRQVSNGYTNIAHRADTKVHSFVELRRFLGKPITLSLISDEDFNAELARCYDRGSNGAMEMIDDLGEELDLARIADSLPEPEDLLETEDQAPIIRLINALLTQAIKEDASDIHIEPFENRLVVRLRVDGVLREIIEPPRAMASLIVSRIKVMAKLDIAEKRLPQDGRISLRVAGRAVDVRVSTLPSGHGERVVLRLLDKQAGRLDLQQLGMPSSTEQLVEELIRRPHGIILVTGPTGSGKTTTLYAALARINDHTRNILTVEDPIEYYLDGVGQTQVSTKVNFTFARGLRAILRQDPDIVMVGEIRDLETAQIAVQASLTGHLVFSTLHTNTAVGTVTRLRDMGVEPFLISSSLLGVLAQRLVRLLCSSCKQPYPLTSTDCEELKLPVGTQACKAQGCEECNWTGYSGRTGIYELVYMDSDMQRLIHDGAPESAIEQHARTHTASIYQDGIQKMLEGLTTIDEVLRVTREN